LIPKLRQRNVMIPRTCEKKDILPNAFGHIACVESLGRAECRCGSFASEHVTGLRDAPFEHRALAHQSWQRGIDQPVGSRRKQSAHDRRRRSRMHRHHALEKITKYVKGNDAAYAGLERCGPNRQATSQRDPNEGHVLKVERIQHSSHRSMPVANERSSLLLKHGSLPRTLKRHDVPALVLK